MDDKGMEINTSVHYSIRYGDAMWAPSAEQMVIGDGDANTRGGEYFGLFNTYSFTKSLDVIGHELTHAVVQYSAKLHYVGQSGALNKSPVDVFGLMIKQKENMQPVIYTDWLIGENILHPEIMKSTSRPKRAHLRSLKNPSFELVCNPQPDTMNPAHYAPEWPVDGNGKEITHPTRNDWYYSNQGGVHTNSSVPNHAFYLVATALKGWAYECAGSIWYATMASQSSLP